MIVPVSAFDLELLAALHAASFPEGWSAEALAQLLAMPGAFGFRRAADGFILCRTAADEAEVITLAVRPSARRQGLGAALLARASAAAGAAGARALFLEVAEDNAAALALYRGAGFAAAGRRPGYYAGRDALLLRRPVGQ